jgi:hypothetical protein
MAMSVSNVGDSAVPAMERGSDNALRRSMKLCISKIQTDPLPKFFVRRSLIGSIRAQGQGWDGMPDGAVLSMGKFYRVLSNDERQAGFLFFVHGRSSVSDHSYSFIGCHDSRMKESIGESVHRSPHVGHALAALHGIASPTASQTAATAGRRLRARVASRTFSGQVLKEALEMTSIRLQRVNLELIGRRQRSDIGGRHHEPGSCTACCPDELPGRQI